MIKKFLSFFAFTAVLILLNVTQKTILKEDKN